MGLVMTPPSHEAVQVDHAAQTPISEGCENLCALLVSEGALRFRDVLFVCVCTILGSTLILLCFMLGHVLLVLFVLGYHVQSEAVA